MGEVVEHEPADGHGAEVVQPGRALQVGQFGAVWVERQGNERLEATGLVLKFSQSDEMVDAMLRRLDMAVEHGGVGLDAEPMGRAVDFEPGFGIGLGGADLLAHFGSEDLGAAAGQTA